jgi:hypothetical protein
MHLARSYWTVSSTCRAWPWVSRRRARGGWWPLAKGHQAGCDSANQSNCNQSWPSSAAQTAIKLCALYATPLPTNTIISCIFRFSVTQHPLLKAKTVSIASALELIPPLIRTPKFTLHLRLIFSIIGITYSLK